MPSNWQAWYRALKAKDPEVYRKAISYPEAISINHNINGKLAAELEVSHVMLACEILGVKPNTF